MEERFAEIRIRVATKDIDKLNEICLKHIDWVLNLVDNKDIIDEVEDVKVLELERQVLSYKYEEEGDYKDFSKDCKNI